MIDSTRQANRGLNNDKKTEGIIMKSHLALAISCLCLSLPVHAISVSGQGTWETTLQGRDLDGDLTTAEAYYDTVLGITWLSDSNYADTGMYWADVNAWAENLNINGYTGWRMPAVIDTGAVGCDYSFNNTDCGFKVDTSTGELAHMFYATLGNISYYSIDGVGAQAGFGLSNTGPFTDVQSNGYWSAPEFVQNTSLAWGFDTAIGAQYTYNKIYYYYAWAVHDGDIGVALTTSSVPLPASVWLFGSGLLGLLGVARKK